MKIKLLTIGTRGDVQPFIALARVLQNNGYDVVICTSQDFEGFVRGHSVGFAPIRANIMKLAQSVEGKRMLGSNPFEIMKQMKKLIYPMMQQMLDDLRIPIIAPTGAFTNPILPFTFRNRWINEKSYHLNRLMLLSFKKLMNTWRSETLNLPPRSIFSDDLCVNGRDIPVLYGCSPSIMPFDPKWKDRVCMEGFWFLEDKDWDPPVELESFIESGPPPIIISYSSMPLKHPDRVLEMTMQALQRTGQRGIIVVGWSGMQASGDGAENILCIQEAPHAWLFPRAAGVIHHGGAGTTAAVLKAGKPMTISPFNADQPFWAKRMYELGVSTKPLPEKSMSVASLVERITELTSDSSLAAHSMALSGKIQEERGIDRTVEFIERRLHAQS
ncbi:glycosyltransferase [Paenibacillus sp. NPDC058910]|uniref:glycosyltransferase n=1 Tax=unclassified Paenibacillus TaxID=185978 RepID=UPI003689408C